MPPSEGIRFVVMRHQTKRGDYRNVSGRHEIRVSQSVHDTLWTAQLSVAHEMVHLKEFVDGYWRNDVEHSAEFCRLADRVCKVHLLDRGQF